MREYLLSSSFIVVMDETYPTLLLLAYLLAKGCSIKTTELDALQNRGFPENITEVLNRMVAEISKVPFVTMNYCMVRSSCTKPPIFQFSCPHKPTFKVCSKCILSIPDDAKCGCNAQEFSSIPLKSVLNHPGMFRSEIVKSSGNKDAIDHHNETM